MIYLIGGAPRVGKTKLVETVQREHPMHAFSTDAVRYMLRRTIPKHDLPAALFLSSEKHIRTGRFEHILMDQNDESAALWPYLEAIMRSYTEDNYDLLLEGVAVLPALVNKLEVPHRVIILGNTSDTHAAKVAEIAALNHHDWLYEREAVDVETFTNFFTHMSQWLEEEAHRYHVTYHEMHDDVFEDDLQQAAHRLLG